MATPNPLPFQYLIRGAALEYLDGSTHAQAVEQRDAELEDQIGRLHSTIDQLSAQVAQLAAVSRLIDSGQTMTPAALSASSAGYRTISTTTIASVPYPTVMIATATASMGGIEVALRFNSRLTTTMNDNPGMEENVVEAKGAGVWAQNTLTREWAVPANAAPGYRIECNVVGVITGALYGQSASTWQRWYHP